MRKAAIKMDKQLAGWLTQDEYGYHFARQRKRDHIKKNGIW